MTLIKITLPTDTTLFDFLDFINAYSAKLVSSDNLNIDFPTQTVTLEFPSKQSALAALDEIGYPHQNVFI